MVSFLSLEYQFDSNEAKKDFVLNSFWAKKQIWLKKVMIAPSQLDLRL